MVQEEVAGVDILEAKDGPRIVRVDVTDSSLTAYLTNGRTIAVPFGWNPRTDQNGAGGNERHDVGAGGCAVQWPGIDEMRKLLNVRPMPSPTRP